MAKRKGQTVVFETPVSIRAGAAHVGEKEGAGPLGDCFDAVCADATFGEKSWEQAESTLLRQTVTHALKKAKIKPEDVDAIFSGDLQNQCTASSFGVLPFGIPFCGMFSACATMALTIGTAALALDSGACKRTVAAACSHFCTAERQFRHPLEYGGQRTPTAQWTVTGAGALVLEAQRDAKTPQVEAAHLGVICDLGVTDPANMGAAMAPAAKETVARVLRDMHATPEDFDLILTGDLGRVGSDLFLELMQREAGLDLSGVHNDCGLMIFDRAAQDVHAGGSGCGCSASVLCAHILPRLQSGDLSRVLFVATGALLSASSPLQKQSIPAVAHAVLLRGCK